MSHQPLWLVYRFNVSTDPKPKSGISAGPPTADEGLQTLLERLDEASAALNKALEEEKAAQTDATLKAEFAVTVTQNLSEVAGNAELRTLVENAKNNADRALNDARNALEERTNARIQADSARNNAQAALEKARVAAFEEAAEDAATAEAVERLNDHADVIAERIRKDVSRLVPPEMHVRAEISFHEGTLGADVLVMALSWASPFALSGAGKALETLVGEGLKTIVKQGFQRALRTYTNLRSTQVTVQDLMEPGSHLVTPPDTEGAARTGSSETEGATPTGSSEVKSGTDSSTRETGGQQQSAPVVTTHSFSPELYRLAGVFAALLLLAILLPIVVTSLRSSDQPSISPSAPASTAQRASGSNAGTPATSNPRSNSTAGSTSTAPVISTTANTSTTPAPESAAMLASSRNVERGQLVVAVLLVLILAAAFFSAVSRSR
jgi:hypothetical protein